MAEYASDPYVQSLNQSTADVRRQVERTIAEINRQRDVAAQQVAQIPGATGSIFAGTRDTVAQDMAAMSGIDRNRNQRVKPLASLMDAFSSGAAAYGRAAGLLTQGLDEQATQRRGNVDSVLQELLADNSSKLSTYLSNRQAEDRQRAFEMGEAERRAALERELMDRDSALQRELLQMERNAAMPPPMLPTSPRRQRPISLMDGLL